MEQVNKLKEQGQVTLNRLRQVGESQPDDVKLWGVTAGSALLGGVTVAAVAKGVVAIVATLANPPVALTVGAIAGGALGWSYMQPHVEKEVTEDAPAESIAAASMTEAPAAS